MEEEQAVPSDGSRSRGHFVTTQWTVVMRAGAENPEDRAAALESLCRTYWYPLYAFVRRKGQSPEAAQDLTQEFFSRLLQGEALQAADPAKGRFRSFLLLLLKRMLVSEWRRENRLKRGGGAEVFSLDLHDAEERYRHEPADAVTPEVLFERQWAETVLERVLARLEEEFSNHTLGWQNLQPYLVEGKGVAPFAQAAARLGVTEAALKAVVYRLRCRYGELFRDEIARTISADENVESEMRHLLAVLAGH